MPSCTGPRFSTGAPQSCSGSKPKGVTVTQPAKKKPLFVPKPPSEEGFQAARMALQQWLQAHQQPDAQAMKQLELALDQLWQAWLGQPVRGLSRQQFLKMLAKGSTTAPVVDVVKALLEASDIMRFSPLPFQPPPVGQYVHQLVQQLPASVGPSASM